MSIPVMILWASTLTTAVAHTIQIAKIISMGSSKTQSLRSEIINALVAVGLTIYSISIGDVPLIVSRIVLLVSWIARSVAVWAYSRE